MSWTLFLWTLTCSVMIITANLYSGKLLLFLWNYRLEFTISDTYFEVPKVTFSLRFFLSLGIAFYLSG